MIANDSPHFKQRRVGRNLELQLHDASHCEGLGDSSAQSPFGEHYAMSIKIALERIPYPERQVGVVSGKAPSSGDWHPREALVALRFHRHYTTAFYRRLLSPHSLNLSPLARSKTTELKTTELG